jgi:hypothetical protein
MHEFEYMAGIWQEQETHAQKLHREWFNAPVTSNNLCSLTTGHSFQKGVPSSGVRNTPVKVSDEGVPDLMKTIRKAAVRCMKNLTKCVTETSELKATERVSSKSKNSFKPWKSRPPECLQSSDSHNNQLNAQRFPFLHASTGPRSSL